MSGMLDDRDTHERIIDLRSDTVTLPTQGMREAMARAEVGDDVLGEDPTVNALQERAATIMGKEAALFMPSGTMANLLAVLSQTRPGDTVILESGAHPFNYESGGLGMVAGVMAKTIEGRFGVMNAADVADAVVRGEDHHFSPTSLVSIENTANRGGGSVYPMDTVRAIAEIARSNDMRLHCDGARLFNASVASGVTPMEYARHADTVSLCFSKGLGAPVGSILTGPAETIDRAHRYRKMLGGGMRQAGVLAAAAIYALDNHVERLADDHARAARFRAELEGVPGLAFPIPSPTNIVFVDVGDARSLAQALEARGVLVGVTQPGRIRAVFHLDISDSDLARAVDAFRHVAIN